jgi:DNA-binding Lrp family transcriptional regulator
VTIDSLDRDILIALQRDGRQTNAHLAESLGLSASAMLERVRRLEQDGQILGYRALVAPEALDLDIQAVIGVRLRVHGRDSIEQFEQHIGDVSGVCSCCHVTGGYDYLVGVAVPDLAALRELIRVDLAAIPGVSKLETMLVLSEVKPFAGWPAGSS